MDVSKQDTQGQEAACAALLRHEGVCLAMLDAEGRFLHVNQTLCALLGRTAEELTALRLQDVAHPDDAEPLECQFAELLAGQQTHVMEEARLTQTADRSVWCIVSITRLTPDREAAAPRCLVSMQNITPLPLAVSQLRHTVGELASRNQELEDLAHVISHHLREPLRGMFNYASLLQEDHGSQLDAEGHTLLAKLLRLARRMEDQLQDLLALARFGHAELACARTDMRQLALEAVENLAALQGERCAHICIPERLPEAICDPLLIAELWQILIGNALRYSDKFSGQVEIGFVDTAPVVYYVRDNGIGIPAGLQERIFMLFKRLHHRDAYGGGSGAGLAIARKIVARHGGRIWVESTPGEGSTFSFTLSGGPACTQTDDPSRQPPPERSTR
ncbi:sensor histidine kinase [Megalodesulfovibrio gigas]|uniref:histidine kinase n=1 Tax=Megalodesulfovibrio gigas (strain ATCC 19364 / DSM 1382 / NCIMB 9332 / VKM B-1759) TaxID=1121448 RepID=T2G947_MEGG1|nr:ATP-binding protein [Megalodesulfovibrio gigas]AGW13100.1 hypothetical protein DGI_1246 [Megalodesulfovibrio gigas DSM 1382 = ATCC 19364]